MHFPESRWQWKQRCISNSCWIQLWSYTTLWVAYCMIVCGCGWWKTLSWSLSSTACHQFILNVRFTVVRNSSFYLIILFIYPATLITENEFNCRIIIQTSQISMIITVMTPHKTCYPKGLFLALANTDHHPSSNHLNWSVNRYTKCLHFTLCWCHFSVWSYHPLQDYLHGLITCCNCLLLSRNSIPCLALHNTAWFVSFVEWIIVHLVMICTYCNNVIPIITVIPYQW